MKGKALLILTIILIVHFRAEIVDLGLPKNCNPSGNCGATKQFEDQSDFNTFVDRYYSKGQNKKWQFQYPETPKRNLFYIGKQYEHCADWMKTDGTYIYLISGKNVSIVKAYPAETSQLVSTISFESYIYGLLIYKDTLAVFGSSYNYQYGLLSSVWIYNVFDRSKPQLKQRFNISGFNYGSCLLQNGFLYLISHFQMNELKILPYYDVGNGKVPFSWSNIHYYPLWTDIYNQPSFINIIAFDLNDPQSTFLASSFISESQIFYKSKEYIYIVQNDQKNSSRSMISKVAINKKDIRPIAFTIVSGNIKNYYNSLSEFQGYLRVVTTNRNDNNETWSNVFILNYYLNTYGKLTNIALNERIFYCAFVNKNLYLVTYRQVDPFFVVDLSNPALPILLGQIKFPGHYTYFQPYPNGQNAIIGIGEKLIEQSKEKVVQATIFNVMSPLIPTQTSSYNIPYQYLRLQRSQSYSQYSYLLLAPHKNIFVLPIATGALLFYISPNTIRLKSVIQHLQVKLNNKTDYSKGRVQKSVYIKDILYTQSRCTIIVTDLQSYKNVKTIPLSCQSNFY